MESSPRGWGPTVPPLSLPYLQAAKLGEGALLDTWTLAGEQDGGLPSGSPAPISPRRAPGWQCFKAAFCRRAGDPWEDGHCETRRSKGGGQQVTTRQNSPFATGSSQTLCICPVGITRLSPMAFPTKLWAEPSSPLAVGRSSPSSSSHMAGRALFLRHATPWAGAPARGKMTPRLFLKECWEGVKAPSKGSGEGEPLFARTGTPGQLGSVERRGNETLRQPMKWGCNWRGLAGNGKAIPNVPLWKRRVWQPDSPVSILGSEQSSCSSSSPGTCVQESDPRPHPCLAAWTLQKEPDPPHRGGGSRAAWARVLSPGLHLLPHRRQGQRPPSLSGRKGQVLWGKGRGSQAQPLAQSQCWGWRPARATEPGTFLGLGPHSVCLELHHGRRMSCTCISSITSPHLEAADSLPVRKGMQSSVGQQDAASPPRSRPPFHPQRGGPAARLASGRFPSRYTCRPPTSESSAKEQEPGRNTGG